MASVEKTVELPEAAELPGYQIGVRLKRRDHLSTFRGVRNTDGAAVIIKMTTEQAPAHVAARLDQEYALTRELDNPGVVRADAFETTTDGYALIFPDTGCIPLSRFLKKQIPPLDTFFVIATQQAEILGLIHAKGVVHKDVKPANFVIDPETLALQIIDFGIAAPLARETASNKTPTELEGSLAYIAPEQTGRMNRSIDGRSDFYALGVTLYQMLTGRLPFETKDPAELVHQHIARLPEPPDTLEPSIPKPLSKLVMKLLAKDPEDRYQSASGLLYDLRALYRLQDDKAEQNEHQIGQFDVPERLLLPERLYGRDAQLRALVSAVDMTACGRAGLVKVMGYSGIGKSSLVREVMRPVAGRHGHFICGKYDQLNRGTPYSAIVQAFEELAPKLLTESRLDVERWRDTLLEALGGNAQVILDVIPGFERLLGKQAPVVELGPSESQYRFNLMFRRFLRALANSDHPLVIFLDDLQWADGASLTLIEVLMSDPDISNLLLICAYRDNEVNAGHPLLLLFAELGHAGTPQESVLLTHLEESSVKELVADSLRVTADEAASLSELVFAKTQGNPFFVRQFLRTLAERDLLEFDTSLTQWRWDVEKIEQQQITDNVVELVAARVHRLSSQSQHLVQLGACIGNLFNLETLAIVSGMSPTDAAAGLASALQQEIIKPIGGAYKYAEGSVATASDFESIWYRFPHDRLHQAAYSTIPEDERPALHEQIGRLILAQSSDEQIEERIFEIVNHLNFASLEHSSEAQRLELANLNLRAGIKAKSSTAYDAALRYLVAGADLLGDAGWKSEPQLTFELHLQRLQATYLSGQFEKTEELSLQLLGRANNTLDGVRVREFLIVNYTSRLQYRKAIQTSVQALSLLGEKVPERPSQLQLALELTRTRLALRGKTTEDLLQLPEMEDPHMLAAMRILLCTGAPAYFDEPNLMPYLALRMVRLSVQYGNAGHSAYGYILYGAVACGLLGDMAQGLAFGKLAVELVEKFDAQDIRGRVLQVFGGFVRHWNEKIPETLPAYLEGASACLDAGDLENHGYNRYAHLSYAYMSGMPLDQVSQWLTQHYAAVLEHKHEKTQFIMLMVREALRELRGPAAGPRTADELAFDEETLIELWTERDQQALAYYHKFRLVTRYMVRDYDACLESVQYITDRFHTVMGMLYAPYYTYFEALALTGLIPSLSSLARTRALRRVRRIQKNLRGWSQTVPENHRPKYLLVTAELKRVTGKHGEAEGAYEEAALLAHRSGSLHDEALAYELLGEFHLALGRKVVARTYLNEAREVYRRWGGYGWIGQMEKRHAAIFGSDIQKPGTDSQLTKTKSVGSHELIDIATITQAARAISEKIVLDDVLRVVLHAAIVNAGAQRGLLLLAQGDELLIKAEASSGTDEVLLHSVALADSEKVPASIVNYVARSQQSIVLDDASLDTTFSGDPYFSRHEARSIICAPLIDKGMLIGFLYLENSLVHGAFTPARIQTLEVLAAQAAISLENARLYREVSDHAQALEIKVKERTEELEDAYGMLRDIFGKYVPKRVAEDLVAGGGSLKPTQATATILFSDIEGFTSISENIPPEQVVEMLNDYFPAVIEPIERYGGIVNQFQGDAMLVTFNVPVADPFHAEKAVQAAIEIQQVLAGRKFAGVTLRTRIGINTGEIIAGNVGSGDRFNYTVHGDAVNLAARIEQLNKEFGTTVLVSETTVDLLRGKYPLELVGEVAIRGKAKPVNLFNLPVPNLDSSFENSDKKGESLAVVETALPDRFAKLWLRCANGDDSAPAWRQLLQGYEDSRRFYHNLDHLVLCLDELDMARPHIEEFDVTEMAVWFHDVIYDTTSPDNESASAAKFRELAGSHMSGEFVDRVCEFILATTHREVTNNTGIAFMLDIDLSSFGLPWAKFLADSQALKKEAIGISDDRFYAGKLLFLDGLLQREGIFQTVFFKERLEQKARDNIERYAALIRAQGFGS